MVRLRSANSSLQTEQDQDHREATAAGNMDRAPEQCRPRTFPAKTKDKHPMESSAIASCSPIKSKSPSIYHSVFFFLLGSCFTFALLSLYNNSSTALALPSLRRSSTTEDASKSCLLTFGTFRGREYRTKETLASRCLVESKFVKIQQHTVQFADSVSTSSVIPDWIWIDYHERINVLVQYSGDNRNSNKEDIRFTVLKQTKYAIEGQSLALVGGIVEPGEEPRDAALREVKEELKLHCDTFVFLGRFRTDVNRGMGWTNGYLAQQCKAMAPHNDVEEPEQVGGADTERQTRASITMDELKRHVMDGKFIEIQWTAITSLALLHLEGLFM